MYCYIHLELSGCFLAISKTSVAQWRHLPVYATRAKQCWFRLYRCTRVPNQVMCVCVGGGGGGGADMLAASMHLIQNLFYRVDWTDFPACARCMPYTASIITVRPRANPVHVLYNDCTLSCTMCSGMCLPNKIRHITVLSIVVVVTCDCTVKSLVQYKTCYFRCNFNFDDYGRQKAGT